MTITAASPRVCESDRLFYVGMSLAMALTVFAGFAPTFFIKDF